MFCVNICTAEVQMSAELLENGHQEGTLKEETREKCTEKLTSRKQQATCDK